MSFHLSTILQYFLQKKRKKWYHFLDKVSSGNKTLWDTMGEKLCSVVSSLESDKIQGYLTQWEKKRVRRKVDARGMAQKSRQNNNEVHVRKIKQKVRGWKDEDQRAWLKWVQDFRRSHSDAFCVPGGECLIT